MDNQFEKMQKLAFGKVVQSSTPETLTEGKGALKNKIKEIIHSTLGEAKKKKKEEEPTDVAPQEDVDIDIDAEETPAPDETSTDDTLAPSDSSDIDIDPKVKSVQDYLQKAYANAKELGDEKLMTQIGNTITMVVRNQVLGGQAVAESLNEEDDIFDESYKVSDEAYTRMDNLVGQSDYMNFINSADKIMRDLVSEGFEVKDVYYYLYTRLLADI
jgi:hypothetical protein